MLIAMGGILRFFKLLNKETLGWTLALTGLFLILDDIGTWMRGGKSLFDYSGLFQFFDMLSQNIDKLGNVLDKHKGLSDFMKGLGTIAEATLAGAAIGSIIPGVGTAIGAAGGAGVGLAIDVARAINQNKPSNINQTNNMNIHTNELRPSDVGQIQREQNAAALNLGNGGY
jgi:hypothetical protein